MIISHDCKFIFVRNVKTASSSIAACITETLQACNLHNTLYSEVEYEYNTIKKYCNPIEIIPTRQVNFLKKTIIFDQHIPMYRIQQSFKPCILNNYTKIAGLRNPWDTYVSAYAWLVRQNIITATFEQWMDEQKKKTAFARFIRPRHRSLTGELIVDKILKFEDIQNEINKLFLSFNLPPRTLPKHKINPNSHTIYKDILTRQSDIDFIAEEYKQDIKIFNYTY